jgi:quercetin dioxygenase-like cupin family protein/DNA-binding XRE family transcriptional regulator
MLMRCREKQLMSIFAPPMTVTILPVLNLPLVFFILFFTFYIYFTLKRVEDTKSEIYKKLKALFQKIFITYYNEYIMQDNLAQIPGRIKELREILEISAIDMARDIGISLETYLKYESGELDIPISALYKISAEFQVDATVLLTGEDPRMDTASVCRRGKGVRVERYPGYEFSSLAYNFKGRTIEPLLVYLDPSKEAAAPVAHSGQEFNYVVSGKVKVTVGRQEYTLETGDSIYFDAGLPHRQAAEEGPAQFITIIQER